MSIKAVHLFHTGGICVIIQIVGSQKKCYVPASSAAEGEKYE